MIVYLDELNLRELFEIRHDRLRDGIQRAIRLTTAREIDVRDAVCIFEFAVPGEAVEHECETLVAFHIAGTLEVFIEHGANQILCGGNKARHRDLIWQLPADQAIVICEIDIHFDK